MPDSALGGLDDTGPLSGTVLVVEDNEVNRMIARQVLLSLGVEVLEASDGAEALDVLEDQSVDLVLMDCQMPVMDGYVATRAIREREAKQGGRRLPIVALTADAFDDDAIRTREAGMDGHLGKPYTRGQLRSLAGLLAVAGRLVRVSAEGRPLGDAGPLLAPGGVELDALDLVQRAFVRAADLADLRPGQALHQAKVARGERERRLSPADRPSRRAIRR